MDTSHCSVAHCAVCQT